MAMISDQAKSLKSSQALFEAIEDYPWSSDEEFQTGLQAIIENDAKSLDIVALKLQAQCFYYSRKFNVQVDVPAYQKWHRDHAATLSGGGEASTVDPQLAEQPDQRSSSEKPPYPLSFNRLVELITEGKEVPGIKDIPDTLLEGQSSQSISSQRRKPWEPA